MMKKAKKTAIMVAAALIVIGLALSVGALCSVKFNLSALNARVNLRPNMGEESSNGSVAEYITQTHVVEEPFKNIHIAGVSSDVRFAPASDNQCSVVITDDQSVTYSVEVENDTLKVIRDNSSESGPYFGIFFGKMEVVVYLPKETYEALTVEMAGGDVKIPENFTFTEATVLNTSGDVSFAASAEKRVCVNTVSGDVRLEGVQAKQIEAKSISGELKLTDAVASGDIQLKTVSGDITLKESDADSLSIKTVSGDVFASLLSDKTVVAHTLSGDVDVPESNNGGKCEIDTTSGDICVTIAK